MKNEQTIAIIKDIANKHITPTEQRAIEKAIAALQYCGNLTYYTETKRFGDKPDMREKIREYISELDKEIERCEKLYEEVSVGYSDPTRSLTIQCRIETLSQVKGDLKSRLEELVWVE